jgi:hypothetical protein
MNTREILNQLDDIELARLDSKERMEKGEARRAILQASFDRAVVRPENVDKAGVIDWNYVESDIYLDGLTPTEGEWKTMIWMKEQQDARAYAQEYLAREAAEEEEAGRIAEARRIASDAEKYARLATWGNNLSPETMAEVRNTYQND